jgi:hypothetical protein
LFVSKIVFKVLYPELGHLLDGVSENSHGIRLFYIYGNSIFSYAEAIVLEAFIFRKGVAG